MNYLYVNIIIGVENMNKNIFLWLDKKYKLSILGIISFIITFFRLILAFFASYIILNSFVNNTLIVCLIILLIMFLDQFDGMIFRKSKMNLSNELTIIRRVFDSVCDRVCIFSICLSLLIDSYDFFNIFIGIIFNGWFINRINAFRWSIKQRF